MRLVKKFFPKINRKQLAVIEDLSWHSSKLYNIVNHQVRTDDEIKPVYTKLEKKFKNNWHSEYLHSHNRQQQLKQLSQDWKSYFSSLKDFKKNPSKYKGMPRPPKFKNMNTNPSQVIFTEFGVRFKDNTLKLSLSKKMQSKYKVKSLNFLLPKPVESSINKECIQQVRIKKNRLTKEWYLLIIFNVEKKEEVLSKNIMALDLGLDNLATVTFKDSSLTYILNGKTIKSRNAYFNKEIARLQSIRMKQLKTSKVKDTKKILSLRTKRRNYVNNYLHKASKKIVDLAVKNKVSTIVIGDVKNIKQKKKNKSFVQIPIQRLAFLVKYKANLEGIKVVKINEAYTSGCSAIDLEKIDKFNYDKSRRFKRGLFKTNSNILINSDVNGSLNILRKFTKDKCSLRPINVARDNGFVSNPKRIRVA